MSSEAENRDQQQFEKEVDQVGGVIVKVAAGVGIVAALILSIVALGVASNNSGGTTTVVRAAPAAPKALPTSAAVAIDHVTRGCHALAIGNGQPNSPNATLHLAVGGRLNLQNDDVMPHRLIQSTGPRAAVTTPLMNHLGATSAVQFPTAGTYSFTTKAGEDYPSAGDPKTIGEDNTIRIKVVVGGQAA